MNKIEIIRRIVANSQAEKITITTSEGKNKKILLDGFTAHMLNTVYEGIKHNPILVEKFEKAHWIHLINLSWKLVK